MVETSKKEGEKGREKRKNVGRLVNYLSICLFSIQMTGLGGGNERRKDGNRRKEGTGRRERRGYVYY